MTNGKIDFLWGAIFIVLGTIGFLISSFIFPSEGFSPSKGLIFRPLFAIVFMLAISFLVTAPKDDKE